MNAQPFPSFLKVSIKPVQYIFEIQRHPTSGAITPAGGVEDELLDILAHSLRFRYDLLVPADNEYGKRQPDGNWSGVVGMVSRGTADIGIATLGVTEPRAKAVGFTAPYATQDTTFATAMPQRLPKAVAFLTTFGPHVWIASAVSLLAVCLALRVVLRGRHSLTRLVFKVVGGLFGEQMNLRVRAWEERFLLGSWLLGSTVMLICYTAVLSAFLTIPLFEKEVGTVEELSAEVVKGRYRCVITRGTLAHALLFDSEQESMRVIGDHIKRHESTWLRAPDGPSRKQLIEEGHTAVVGPRTVFELDFSKELGVSKYLSKDSFAITYNAIALRPGFCCAKALDTGIRRITEAGLYEFHFKLALFKAALASNVEVPEDVEIFINIQDIGWTFVLLRIGYAVGFVALILEILLHKFGFRKSEYLQKDKINFLEKRLESKKFRSHEPGALSKEKKTSQLSYKRCV